MIVFWNRLRNAAPKLQVVWVVVAHASFIPLTMGQAGTVVTFSMQTTIVAVRLDKTVREILYNV